MRNAIKVVLFLCTLTLLTSGTSHALSAGDLALTEDPMQKKAMLSALKEQAEALKKAEAEKQEKLSAETAQKEQEVSAPELIVQHTVAPGESLSTIANQYGSSWKRIFDKNLQVADPNLLNIGVVLTIPEATEQLAERPLPESATPVSAVSTTVRKATVNHSTGNVARGSSAGNTHTPGYCTWYAKNRRPDLPNRLGNASSWVASAAARGFATGSEPRVGAIGQQGNHVVYVEGVNDDGTVTVSEMNYRGLFVISSRTASAASFRYIY